MLIITEREIRQLYSMKRCLEDVERAFRYHREGNTVTPVRTALPVGAVDAHVLNMPSYVGAVRQAGVKVVSVFPHNPEQGRPAIQGVVLLTDGETGDPVALLDAAYLTMLRTGAASGIATKYMARHDARTCAVLGCGAQAIGQIQAVLEVRPIERILLYNRTRERAEALRETLRGQWEGDVVVVDRADDAVAQADIVICSTRATAPLFDGTRLKPGTHINAIGSYLPHMQEIDVATLHASHKIVVDTREGVLSEAGDFLVPMRQGKWSPDRIYAELAEIVAREKPGRESDEEITLFKSVGVAFLDVVVAHGVYRLALEQKVGTRIAWT
ncbi:ornithine cyclodeaminase family protein [Calditerricola satsumensis]|uniref:Delta(1)-pyrroline-2-carboxylate reductase n=1 Tax=Calditerricola satsumensis TaxID=373054 RepID=A0A8J3FCT6_9BACI|nr:ornithine cyclodeaminase [Calditerricola satsumensis]GGK07637.1 delta(1)-pyrroline-2-carboxylate reductase [Calditerricola satsumensis]